MALYILDKPYCENGIPYAQLDEEAKVLLLHDGIYIDLERLAGKEIYVVEEEAAMRGMAKSLPESIKKIDYSGVIDLILDNRVINFA